jgi:hypothetical protein
MEKKWMTLMVVTKTKLQLLLRLLKLVEPLLTL